MQEIKNKLTTYLGFSIKSNKILFGMDNILGSNKKQALIILCSSITDKNQQKLFNFCKKKNFALIKLKTTTLSEVLKRDNVKSVSIMNYDLAQAIFSLTEAENFEILKRGIF